MDVIQALSISVRIAFMNIVYIPERKIMNMSMEMRLLPKKPIAHMKKSRHIDAIIAEMQTIQK